MQSKAIFWKILMETFSCSLVASNKEEKHIWKSIKLTQFKKMIWKENTR